MATPLRSAVNALPTYTFAEQTVAGVARVVQLGQNELGVDPSPHALEALRAASARAARYPDPDHVALRHAIAEVHDLQPAQVMCGAGSMELMGLLATLYCEPGVEVVVSQYGYKYFQVLATIAGAEVRVVPEPELRVDVDALAAAVTERTRIVFVVDPNNPTGTRLGTGRLARLREMLPARVLLVFDGAYAEFAGAGYEPGFDLVDAGRNVVVLRTFSKAYGLAGLRVGWAYVPPAVGEALSRVRAPNSVSTPALAGAEAAVRDREHLSRVVAEVVRLREALRERAQARGLTALPSEGNFVLLRCPPGGACSAESLVDGLRRAGIVVRPMGAYGLRDCVRVTVGSPEEMRFLDEQMRALT